MLRHPEGVHAAAIWNANFSAGLSGRAAQTILAWEKFRLGSDVPSRLLPRLTFQAWGKQVPNHRTAFDWLSRDPDEVQKYIDDPLCGWDASVSLWQDLFGFVFTGADDRNFSAIRKDLPFNLVGGEKDPATDGGKAVEHLADRLKRMGFSNLVSTVYADTRHESLNELNRDVIMAGFCGVGWTVRLEIDALWPIATRLHQARRPDKRSRTIVDPIHVPTSPFTASASSNLPASWPAPGPGRCLPISAPT